VAGALHLAAVKLRDKVARMAAAQLGCEANAVRFEQGKAFADGAPDQALPFGRLTGTAHWSPGQLPEGMEPALRESVFWTPQPLEAPTERDEINTSAAYGFAFDVCAVEVDRATGCVRIDRYVTCHDAGRLLNPALADGQVRGGFAQALGAALLEELRYAPDGAFQSGTFADYLPPTACEVPDPVIVHLETPSPFTPLGAKGIGEGNSMSTPVCIANAVADALGVAQIELPLTPAKVMELIGVDDPPPATSAAQPAAPQRPWWKRALQGSAQ
jgi:2-furoyl-CoA dehydrogenase large subunit